mgnify:CR=1 FL=1
MNANQPRSLHQLERGFEDHGEGGPRLGAEVVQPQAAEDVLHVDDGVINHLADRDGQAAECYRVEADAETLEHDHRPEQGERDRQQGDQRGADLPEEEEEEHDLREERHEGTSAARSRRGFV